MATPVVRGEFRAPDSPCRRQLRPVPVGDVADALLRQCVADVAPFAPALQRPQVLTRLCSIWLTLPSETPSQRARCSRGIIGWSVIRSSVPFSDGVRPKAGADETMCSVSGSDARLRSRGSVNRPRFGLPRVPMNSSQ